MSFSIFENYIWRTSLL